MPLESCVHDERTSSWVHSCNQLSVFDIFKSKLTLVIPMLVVSMLSQESNGILRVIRISCWHVHVINKVEKLEFTNWGEGLTSFLLKLLLKIHLEEIGVSVEIEIDDLLQVFISLSDEFVEKTLDDLGLTTSCKSNQDWAMVDLNELSHQILG